ncbi:hypothetical protein SAVCW2_28050 [Streptomyces avermitilis]|nr:hypothetical protein SAVCW2_28050 [Streptomyces avermitilis]
MPQPSSCEAPSPPLSTAPPPPPSRNPYLRLFTVPGTRAFTVGNLIARLPMGMFSVSAVVMIAGSRGSYALAGAVTATGLAATALVAPLIARLIDRHGQARIAVPATAVAALGSLALLLCVRYGTPDWTLFAAYAATATTPNTGACHAPAGPISSRATRRPYTPRTPSNRPRTSCASCWVRCSRPSCAGRSSRRRGRWWAPSC